MPSVKVIQIRNVAGISTRVHVLPPETPYFQVDALGEEEDNRFNTLPQPSENSN